MTVPGLSTVVYVSDSRIPRSQRAPGISLRAPQPSDVSRGRMHVSATVSGSSFYEVTFQRRVGHGPWRTDRHGRLGAVPGLRRRQHAATGHSGEVPRGGPRQRRHTGAAPSARSARVPSPSIRISSPAGPTVTAIDPVHLEAAVDPERAAQSVTFQRRVGSGAWTTLGTDTSSPAYTLTDDVSELPIGTSVSYRAVLHEGSLPTVTSAPVTVTTADPVPLRTSVTVAGSLQSELGCPERLAARVRRHPPGLRHLGRPVARHLHPPGRQLRVEGRDQRLVGRELRRRRRVGRRQPRAERPDGRRHLRLHVGPGDPRAERGAGRVAADGTHPDGHLTGKAMGGTVPVQRHSTEPEEEP